MSDDTPQPLWRRLLIRIPPPYALALVFGGVLLVLRLTLPKELSGVMYSVRYALTMVAVFVVAGLVRGVPDLLGKRGPDARFTPLQDIAQMLRDWLPFVFCLWIYENLHDYTYLIREDTVDDALAAADAWIFGVQPTLWLEQYSHPLLSDYMAVAYMTYFVFPPLLAGWLYFRGQQEAFMRFQTALLVAFFGGFIGYISVPAVGPQFILLDQYQGPLEGEYFFWGAKWVVAGLQTFPRDCFPSLHTGISTVTLVFYMRNRVHIPLEKIVTPVMIILTVSLWISTVYLRYHWFVDVIAGWILAAGACAAGIALIRVWPQRGLVDRSNDEGTATS